jgi:hypothetical protein
MGKIKKHIVEMVIARAELSLRSEGITLAQRDIEFAKVIVDTSVEVAPATALRTPMTISSICVILLTDFKTREAEVTKGKTANLVLQEGFQRAAHENAAKAEQEMASGRGPLTRFEKLLFLWEDVHG